MLDNDIALIQDFHHRFRRFCATSGHGLIYETLALIREYIPCREIGFVVGKTASENPGNLWWSHPPLGVATRKITSTQDAFYRYLPSTGFAQQAARDVIGKILRGEPMRAISFADYPQWTTPGKNFFYEKIVKITDLAATGGLVQRHEIIESPYTASLYFSYIVLARDGGERFVAREKDLLSVFYDIFLEGFRERIAASHANPYLPLITREKFSPRELATIRVCFDLAAEGADITGPKIAARLHLGNAPDGDAAALKKALDKVYYDLAKIRKRVLKRFEQDTPENYRRMERELTPDRFPSLFRAYAYFGFYPPPHHQPEQFVAYLAKDLDKWR